MRIYLALLILLCQSILWAQKDIPFSKDAFPNKKEEFKEAFKELKLGNELFEFGKTQYKNALKHYTKAHAFNPDNAELNYKMGICIINTIHRAESVDYFERAYQLNPTINDEIYYYLGLSHHLHTDWDEAIKFYRLYEEKLLANKTKKNADEIDFQYKTMERRIEECKNGKEISKTKVRAFIDNIGKEINTPYAEFGPVITADESMMLFTSRRPGSTGFKDPKNDGKDREEIEYYEDIYVTYKDAKGNWSQPQNLGRPVNTDGHDATVYLSPDGQRAIVYNSDKGGSLYETALEGETWSKPKRLDKTINSDNHETSATFSLDQNTLYFVSNKPDDNFGGHDIFYSEWDEKKQRWGEAKNIGPEINTPYNEEGVFMHADGKTMYFSSEGHNSMGGYDIFKTTLVDGKWTKPVNMGFPVNGPDHDVFFVMNAHGNRGYYASQQSDGYGEKDIYVISFLGPEKQVISLSEDNLLANALLPVSEKVIEPEVEVTTAKTTILKGKIIDAISLKPLYATIELIDNTKNTKVATFKSNSKTGDFLVSLPSGRNYGIAVLAENYLFHSENFDIPDNAGYSEHYKEIKLKNVAVGSTIVLKNIFFDYDKSTLRDESKPELGRLIELLNEVSSLKIEISGHTDSRGSAEYNQKLSESRAKSVVDYLTKNGINANRLTFVGYGKEKPIATNDTEEGRQENRRTEFKIVSK